MSNGGKIYEVKCPSCGAPLPMSGERITCDYCGAVLEREQPAMQKQAASPTVQEPQMIVIQTGYTTTSSRRKSGGSSCLSGLFTFILIIGIFGGIGWFQFWDQLSALSGLVGLSDIGNLAQLPEQIANKATVTSLSRIILLPGSNDGSPDFLTFTYQTSASTYALTYVDAVSSTIRWQGPPLKEWYSTKILSSPETLYFTDETKLYALSRETGQVVWQTSMADKLAPSCTDCFELMNDRLVALVQGGTVQGFDSQSGQLLWNKRLNFEPTSRLLPAGDQLLIFDRTVDNTQILMHGVNPARGESSGEVTLPECAGEWIDLTHPMVYD
ncbi:MAG: PQQ-binding-like beta-propeller repeat protein [Chloroflexi bacterium]|nr:PQQ-binding-like beta-propeller repeat protein [Chloroflexota bacterium]